MKSTVLLIDDDPIDLKALTLLMADLDLDAVAVRSGSEALERLRRAPFDLVVSDVRMPEMSGEDVVRAVGVEFPGLPVVLITAHGDVPSAVRAMKAGALDYVLKPPDAEEFRLTVERALEHGRLRRENAFLRAELAAGGMYGERLIGRSPAMLAVFDVIRQVARTDSTVLITGETGTGKELVAQTIHFQSARAARPLVALNCAALNPNLIESELFGHEKGAFTGAVATRRGRFEDADGGTLFLDEVGETHTEFQAKLLRVLQEGEFQRIGGNRSLRVDVRLLVSTHRDLKKEVEAGRFREDLFYRLNVIPVRLSPLRERRDDIEPLATHFLAVYSGRYGTPARSLTREALDFLRAQEWRGNVRELQHAVERAVVLSPRDALTPADFRPPEQAPGDTRADRTLQGHLDRQTQSHLTQVLEQTGWRKTEAARILGIDRATLYRLLQRYRIERG